MPGIDPHLLTPTRVGRAVIALAAAWAIAFGARKALDAPFGLRADYFTATDPTSESPALSIVDQDVSTGRVKADWLGDPPPSFQVRWFGYLNVNEPGAYTFEITSDDGSRITVDGAVIVDNGGLHGASTKSGVATLGLGPHPVLIEYVQAGGDYELTWRWSHGGKRLSAVPTYALSPRRLPAWKIRAARAIDVMSSVLLAIVLLSVLAFGGFHAPAIRDTMARYPRLACLGLFFMLAVAETWPLAAHPSRLSRNDNGDTVLNEWVLSWIVHQAPRSPLHLFDGNIFHPERRTIAFAEAMIVQSAAAAPVLWLGGSPVLAYNLVLLAGFALSGWTMSLVLFNWTRSWLAAVTGGILFAFNAHMLTRLPHLQTQHVEFLPLALLALDRVLIFNQTRDAVRLAAWTTLQALTSIYLLVLTATALTVSVIARPTAWTARFRRVAPRLVLAAGLAVLLLAPYVFAYWRVSSTHGVVRTLEDVNLFAASWNDYLATPGRLDYELWSHSWFERYALFPGAVGLALTCVAIARGVAFTDPRARMCLAFGIVGVFLSFGTKAPGYQWLYQAVPLLHAVRAVSRFGYLGIVAVSVLAAFGVAHLGRTLVSRPARAALAIVPALVAVEACPAPIWYSRFEGIPAIYGRLRAEPNAVVVELPFPGSRMAFRHATYMLNSTAHWKPLVNGYSGFQPASFYSTAERLAGFPDRTSLERLKELGVTHVFVHANEFRPDTLAAIDRVPALHRIAAEQSIVLYRLDGPLNGDGEEASR